MTDASATTALQSVHPPTLMDHRTAKESCQDHDWHGTQPSQELESVPQQLLSLSRYIGIVSSSRKPIQREF